MANIDLKQIVSQVAAAKEKFSEKKVVSTQVLVFDVDQEEYAVDINVLREIIPMQDITPIPNAPEFIKGILNLRGQIVVIIDLEKRFNLVREKKGTPKHIIITDVAGTFFGVIVDLVKEVLTIPVDSIKPTPDLISAKIHADYLSGIVVFGDENNNNKQSRLIVLLDLPKLLQEKELLKIGESIKKLTN